MTADQRVQSAREYLGYARKCKIGDLPYSAVVRLAAELRRQLGEVLDVIAEQEAADPVFGAMVDVVADDAGRLAAIRDLLAHFDWEYHDKQLALEEISRIAGGER